MSAATPTGARVRTRRPRRTTATSGIPVAPPRGVNLLSPWVLEGIRVHRLRKRFAYALVALLVVIGGAWSFQQLRLSSARADLRGEVAVGDSLRLRIAGLAPVATYVADVRARGTTVRDVMATEASLSDALRALRRATPSGSSLDAIAVTLPVPGVPAEGTDDRLAPVTPSPEDLVATRGIIAACPGPDPFATRQVVACVELTGTAPDRQSVSVLVRQLAANDLFVEPFIDATTTAEGLVSFTGSVGLSPEAFTGRYDGAAADPSGSAGTDPEAGR